MAESLESIAGRWAMSDKEANQVTKTDNAVKHWDNERKYCQLCKRHHFRECAKKCENCRNIHYGPCRLPPKKDETAAKLEVNSVNKDARQWYSNSSSWYVDSGANCHITCEVKVIQNPIKSNFKINVADSRSSRTSVYGSVDLILESGERILVKKVICLPSANKNLLSASLITELGFTIKLNEDGGTISHNGVQVARLALEDGLYRLMGEVFDESNANHQRKIKHYEQAARANTITANLVTKKATPQTWHARLGHIGKPALEMMVKSGMLDKDDMLKEFCNSCAMGKSVRLPFKKSHCTTKLVGDLVVSDLKFYPEKTHDGRTCYLSIIDVHSGFSFMYLLSKKSEAAGKIVEYAKMFKNQFGRSIKRFRSDNGTEYVL